MNTVDYYSLRFSKRITEKRTPTFDVITAMITKNAVWWPCAGVTEGPDNCIIKIGVIKAAGLSETSIKGYQITCIQILSKSTCHKGK
jgi:hypothetical protein